VLTAPSFVRLVRQQTLPTVLDHPSHPTSSFDVTEPLASQETAMTTSQVLTQWVSRVMLFATRLVRLLEMPQYVFSF